MEITFIIPPRKKHVCSVAQTQWELKENGARPAWSPPCGWLQYEHNESQTEIHKSHHVCSNDHHQAKGNICIQLLFWSARPWSICCITLLWHKQVLESSCVFTFTEKLYLLGSDLTVQTSYSHYRATEDIGWSSSVAFIAASVAVLHSTWSFEPWLIHKYRFGQVVLGNDIR